MSVPLVFTAHDDGVLVAPRQCGLIAAPDFLDRVQSWCSTAASPELVVDLSQVEAFEVGALRALLWARRHCLARGLRIAVVLPPTGVLRPHETMLLQELFGASHRAAHNGADASPRITPTSPSGGLGDTNASRSPVSRTTSGSRQVTTADRSGASIL